MKFNFIWVGKTRDKNWKALQEEYLQRLSHFVRTSIVEVKDGGEPGKMADAEGKRLLPNLHQKGLTVLLDVTGKQLSSHKLADEIENWQNRGIKEVTFVIGGAEGVSSEVASKADSMLSLSILTFTHEMTRVILLEQLYRAYSILNGFPYQK